MPMIISFAKTTGALLAGKKTVTRRDWPESHAKKYKAGDVAIAYDKQPCLAAVRWRALRF